MKTQNPTRGRKRTEEEKINMSLAKTKTIYTISNTLFDNDCYQVIGLKSFCEFAKHHWNRNGKRIIDMKKFHCYKITSSYGNNIGERKV